MFLQCISGRLGFRSLLKVEHLSKIPLAPTAALEDWTSLLQHLERTDVET